MLLLFLLTIASTIRAENGTDTTNLKKIVSGQSVTAEIKKSSIGKSPRCMLTSVDPHITIKITHLLKVEKVSLIEYQLSFSNYSVNPLKESTIKAYKLDKWSRVTTAQGQILLSLAFNYGVLSVQSLTIGTRDLDVDLVDHPSGCMGSATEEEKIESIKYLLVRDFQNTTDPTLKDEERVCHEVILEDSGYALFRDRCYYRDPNTNEIAEDDDIENIWLTFLYVLLLIVRYSAIFFGPCLFISFIDRLYRKSHPYVVYSKDALVKTIFITQKADDTKNTSGDTATKKSSDSGSVLDEKIITRIKNWLIKESTPRNTQEKNVIVQGSECKIYPHQKKFFSNHHEKEMEYSHLVDLSDLKGFPKLMSFVKNNQLLLDKRINVKFPEYHIKVDYNRLLTENKVNVGLFRSLYDAIFQCSLRTKGPFKKCCNMNMYGLLFKEREEQWIKFWRKVAKASMVVLIPVPYYIRLIIYYSCEHEEVVMRKSFIERAGLREKYETSSSLMHYLTPTHPLFIIIYTVYAVFIILMARLPKEEKRQRLIKIIVGCFRDLKTLSWTDTLSMVVSNVILPFRYFGILGCLVCLIYWPIVLPLTLIVALIYTIPLLYLTVRVVFYSRKAIFDKVRKQRKAKSKSDNSEVAPLLEKPEKLGDTGTPQEQFEVAPAAAAEGKHKVERYKAGQKSDKGMLNFEVARYLEKPEKNPGDAVGTKERIPIVAFLQKWLGVTDEANIVVFLQKLLGVTDKATQEQFEDDAADEIVGISIPKPLDESKKSTPDDPGRLPDDPYSTDIILVAAYASFATLYIATLYGVMIILSEVIGSFVEIAVFTIMGVILNAAELLKYITLALILFFYCCDTFNNVNKKYGKLNDSLFGEIKKRVKDLYKVTGQLSDWQENQGFKTQELKEQGNEETPDDIPDKPRNHWFINDLCLFVDSEDTPRIPKLLFDKVCEIRVAGVPGPVYEGLIEAVKQLLKIILFVVFIFIVVLTFSSVYRVSTTNQLLATMVGGFLPMVLKHFSPPPPDIKLQTVSFESKLDEVIKHFYQAWPIYDLPFKMAEEPDTRKNPDGAGSNSIEIGIAEDGAHYVKTTFRENAPIRIQIDPLIGESVNLPMKKTETNGKSPPLKVGGPGTAVTEVDFLIILPKKRDEDNSEKNKKGDEGTRISDKA